MENEQKQTKDQLNQGISLEGDPSNQDQTPPPNVPAETAKPPDNPFKKIWVNISKRWSIYFPVFVVLVIALVVFTVLIYDHHTPTTPSLNQQTLTPSELSNLASGNQVVGNSNEVLTVQSSSIFNGQVLVRGQLQVAASGLAVAGSSQIEQLQIAKSLAVAGTVTVQGTLTLQSGLSVNGTGNFSGSVSTPQLTTSSLQLNGDLSIDHHIDTNGSIPSHTTGSAVGSGGTTSINGSDTAGTVTINTGGDPSIGCYISVNFAASFANTPHVLLTPVGSSSVGLEYYVNRSSSGFSICSANAPQSAQSYVFDYFVID
jgi:cytoskeletal protein CcmA (bactofilin family)